jgi:hypothetical protein
MGRLVQQPALVKAIGDIPPAEAEANYYLTTTPSAILQMAEPSLQ